MLTAHEGRWARIDDATVYADTWTRRRALGAAVERVRRKRLAALLTRKPKQARQQQMIQHTTPSTA